MDPVSIFFLPSFIRTQFKNYPLWDPCLLASGTNIHTVSKEENVKCYKKIKTE